MLILADIIMQTEADLLKLKASIASTEIAENVL